MLEEIEFRVFDAIIARGSVHRYESTRQNFKTKYHSLRRLTDLDRKYSIGTIFWQIKLKILATFLCVWRFHNLTVVNNPLIAVGRLAGVPLVRRLSRFLCAMCVCFANATFGERKTLSLLLACPTFWCKLRERIA